MDISYVEENDFIYKNTTFADGGEIKTLYCSSQRAEIIADKQEIEIKETLNLTFSWAKFDLETMEYIPDPDNTNNFEITVLDSKGGIVADVEVEHGTPLEFMSEMHGTFTIMGHNNSLKVEVVKNG